jgi:hypothetical protein
MDNFRWYRANDDGTADVFEDSPEVCALVDAGEGSWFGNPEGAILHGGVIATAFTRKTEATYDATLWLTFNIKRELGEITMTKITAEPPLLEAVKNGVASVGYAANKLGQTMDDVQLAIWNEVRL